jgi:hypothetical protein
MWTTHKTNYAIVRILIPMAYLPEKYRIQEATLGPGNRIYIFKGAAGHKSISIKSVEILSCGVMFLKNYYNI